MRGFTDRRIAKTILRLRLIRESFLSAILTLPGKYSTHRRIAKTFSRSFVRADVVSWKGARGAKRFRKYFKKSFINLFDEFRVFFGRNKQLMRPFTIRRKRRGSLRGSKTRKAPWLINSQWASGVQHFRKHPTPNTLMWLQTLPLTWRLQERAELGSPSSVRGSLNPREARWVLFKLLGARRSSTSPIRLVVSPWQKISQKRRTVTSLVTLVTRAGSVEGGQCVNALPADAHHTEKAIVEVKAVTDVDVKKDVRGVTNENTSQGLKGATGVNITRGVKENPTRGIKGGKGFKGKGSSPEWVTLKRSGVEAAKPLEQKKQSPKGGGQGQKPSTLSANAKPHAHKTPKGKDQTLNGVVGSSTKGAAVGTKQGGGVNKPQGPKVWQKNNSPKGGGSTPPASRSSESHSTTSGVKKVSNNLNRKLVEHNIPNKGNNKNEPAAVEAPKVKKNYDGIKVRVTSAANKTGAVKKNKSK